ncbi:hypothetical protein SH661x_004436 [Planctomicrobium sp. SH661]|uniref:hypothetical protein n=1 Tax=Planctomicrobium sp. SH661 TaxID=3448124 RepID=UPI003F5B3CC9
MALTHGIRFDQTQFWITHRRREYGPFDYDWSADLRGMELLYQGTKFGEICSAGEIFADMREFQLPMRVVEVACVVLGSIVLGVSAGFNAQERSDLLVDTLTHFDCCSFLPANPGD